jgi:hypothetical protein
VPATAFATNYFDPVDFDAWKKSPLAVQRQIFDPYSIYDLTCGRDGVPIEVKSLSASGFSIIPLTRDSLEIRITPLDKQKPSTVLHFEKGKRAAVISQENITGADIVYAVYTALELIKICSGIVDDAGVKNLMAAPASVKYTPPGAHASLNLYGISSNAAPAVAMSYKNAHDLLAPSAARPAPRVRAWGRKGPGGR